MSQSRFITPFDSIWSSALSRCSHDIYHLPTYALREAEWSGTTSVAFYYESGSHCMLLPLLEQPTPAGLGTDAVTPYGYSSPVFSHGAPRAFRGQAIAAFQTAAQQRGLVATFIRLHPLLCPALELPVPPPHCCWNHVQRGVTVTMPMGKEQDAWMLQVGRDHRLGICKLRRQGCYLLIDTDAAWQAFPGIYRATMERIGAKPAYIYSDAYLMAFRRSLDPLVHCAAIADADGTILCAALFTLVNHILQYHLSGTATEAIRHAPTKLLLADMRLWARHQGVQHFHLGGGYGGSQDSLFAFKSRFGGEQLPFQTVSIVHDAERYEAECQAWLQRSGLPLADPDGFFPAYRAPRLVGESSTGEATMLPFTGSPR